MLSVPHQRGSEWLGIMLAIRSIGTVANRAWCYDYWGGNRRPLSSKPAAIPRLEAVLLRLQVEHRST